ncbi:anti-sigma factor [Pseudarthrobacter sp. R1]|uniref:anti-sigma factor n=1 Tax=Pseudarthrobacter sp. R1 TaxID=2944934 RepID=UPI002108E247|nr:anti-sigma factor [Pseudarthrobacter sp. R1]MCQ6271548.1 anti-sigma factor [Pseudarthrobacter sp. R1]
MRPQFPLSRRHQRTASHIQSCHQCASALRRERQYLERLRDAPIPPASDDLTARLLARTQELAARPPVPAPHHQASRAAVRVLAMTAGGTVAAAGVLAAGAFAVAGEPLQADGAAATLSQVSVQTPADGRALSVDRLSGLRSEGWVCPELGAMGFRLESAKAVMLEGRPAVELKLSDGTHYATITERQNPGGTEEESGSGQTGPPLQILATSPWSATYRTQGRTFTYVSDLPAEQADDAVPILQRLSEQAGEGVAAEALKESLAQHPEPVAQRLQRGVNKIVALFTQ